MFKSYLLFLMGAGSGLGTFEMLFITASGKISENPSDVFFFVISSSVLLLMAIGMTFSVKSKSAFGADTSLFGSNLSLGWNTAQTFIGGRFHLGMWAGMILE